MIKVLDVIRMKTKHKRVQPPLCADDPTCEVRTALVRSVEEGTNRDGEKGWWFTYVPYPTPECPDPCWCRYGSNFLPANGFTKPYGIQALEVIKHLERDPDAVAAEARMRHYGAMYKNPGYDPLM